jgi:hypothetical protein
VISINCHFFRRSIDKKNKSVLSHRQARLIAHLSSECCFRGRKRREKKAEDRRRRREKNINKKSGKREKISIFESESCCFNTIQV